MLNVIKGIPNHGVFYFSFVENSVYSFTLSRGKYLLEVWGASGGNQSAGGSRQLLGEGGKGGYSRGILIVYQSARDLFCYVGGHGPSHSTITSAISKGGFNGGGSSLARTVYGGGSGGGGATDICTIKSNMNTNNVRTNKSYKSRIIVGGGGGGGFGSYYNVNQRVLSYGGNGGGLTSQGSGYQQSNGCSGSLCDNLNQGDSSWPASFNYVTGSNQTSTGVVGCFSGKNNAVNGAKPGNFGFGGSATNGWLNSGGGGGGGWFGGYGGTSGGNSVGIGGAGGSGYIHNSKSHNPFSSLDSTYDLEEGKSYDGSLTFPSPTIQNKNETGHIGNGYARITLLSTLETKQTKKHILHLMFTFCVTVHSR